MKIYNRYTHTKEKRIQYNANGSHQITREENKREKEEKRPTKANPKQLIKWQ